MSFVFVFYFEIGYYHVVLTGLTIWSLLALSSQKCACLCLPRAEIEGVYHQAGLGALKIFFSPLRQGLTVYLLT